MENNDKTHESYGQIRICKFNSNGSEYFGSDIVHNGGVSIEISRCSVDTKYNQKYFHEGESLIKLNLSNSQYVDLITSAMNTQGVPCTLLQTENRRVPQISHVENKIETFKRSMEDTQQEYRKRIDEIIDKLTEGTLGKKKIAELKHDLEFLRSHIKSNTPFVMDCFEEQMESTIVEAKQSVSLYVDNKVRSLGIEHLTKEVMVSIDASKKKNKFIFY